MNVRPPERRRQVLLGWELGAGLEHVTRLEAIAGRLAEDGWQPVIAVRNLDAAARLQKVKCRVVQAPIPPSLTSGISGYRCGSYAEILNAYGFFDERLLSTLLGAWSELITMIGPDLVVADYAPGLVIACHGRVPAICIGDGFVVPPSQLPAFPLLHKGGSSPVDEPVALAAVNRVLHARGQPAAKSLPALLGGAAQVVSTLPELDVYREQRGQEAAGPQVRRYRPLPPPRTGDAFFYLAADATQTWPFLGLLAECGGKARGFVRDADAGRIAQMADRGIIIHREPQDMAGVLRDHAMIIHHGGIGTSEAALLSGRPQLLVPRHLEQALNSNALMRLGAAVVLGTPFKAAAARKAIEAAWHRPSVREAAMRTAERIERRSAARPSGLEVIAALSRQLTVSAGHSARLAEEASACTA